MAAKEYMERDVVDEGPALSLRDYLDIIRHRFALLVLPAILISAIGVALALGLPPVYRSTATILVESQQIPTQLVQSMVTSFAEERIQVIRQRVMTRENLLQIIDKFGLYRDQNMSLSEMIAEARRNIAVNMISTRQGSQSATIAFTVSFEHRTAGTAQKVANELVTLFLSENAEARTKRATETTEFLAQEAERLNKQIQSIEQQIAEYKEQFSDSLPENLALNTGALERARGELRELDREVKSTEEQKGFYEVQLLTLRANASQQIAQSSGNVLSPAEQLIALQNELTAREAELMPSHPDIKSLQSRIASFKRRLETEGTRDEIEVALEAARADLGRLQGLYTERHPEVTLQQEHVAALAARLQTLPARAAAAAIILPGYREIEARIEAMDGRLAGFVEQRKDQIAKVEDLERRVEKTPQVERGFKSLARDYENATAKYREVRNKQMEAQLAQNLEEDRKAERFSLLEPADHPERPQRPNRLGIMMLGLFLGIGTGGGGVFVAELLDRSVRSQAQLNAILEEPLLMTVPYIVTQADERRWRRRKRLVILALVAGIAVAAVAVHFFYRPLGALWLAVLQRLGLG